VKVSPFYSTLFLYVLVYSTRWWSNEWPKHVVEHSSKRTYSVRVLRLCRSDCQWSNQQEGWCCRNTSQHFLIVAVSRCRDGRECSAHARQPMCRPLKIFTEATEPIISQIDATDWQCRPSSTGWRECLVVRCAEHRTEKPPSSSIQGRESADRFPKPATVASQLELVIVTRPRRQGSSRTTLFILGVRVPITLAS
jgi:hypothetical protein